KLPEGEQGSIKDKMYHLPELEDLFGGFGHILENTAKVMGCCQIEFAFDEGRENQDQPTYLNNREADYTYLLDLVNTRIHSRYKNVDAKVRTRIDKELDAIRQMDFVSYFLINYDIVQYAIKKGYPYIGRGSG